MSKLAPKDIEIVKKSLEGASALDIERFIRVCERTGLDPITKQIYGRVQSKKVRNWNGREWVTTYVPEIVIIIGIDGFRTIAESTGQYRGQTHPEWLWANQEDGEGPKWRDWCTPGKDGRGNPLRLPEAARIGVYRENFPQPTYGYAAFESFAAYELVVTQKAKDGQPEKKDRVLGTFWRKMPEHQIAKCAEAQAFRKAFPQLLGDLYIEEEVVETEETDGQEPAPKAPESPAAPEKKPEPVETPKPEEKPQKKAPAKKPEQPKPEPVEEKKPEPVESSPGGEPELGVNDEPDFGGADEEEESAALDSALNYQLKTITHADYKGKPLKDLSFHQLKMLITQWVRHEKFKDVIPADPEKKQDAAQIEVVFDWAEKIENLQTEENIKRPISSVIE